MVIENNDTKTPKNQMKPRIWHEPPKRTTAGTTGKNPRVMPLLMSPSNKDEILKSESPGRLAPTEAL